VLDIGRIETRPQLAFHWSCRRPFRDGAYAELRNGAPAAPHGFTIGTSEPSRRQPMLQGGTMPSGIAG